MAEIQMQSEKAKLKGNPVTVVQRARKGKIDMCSEMAPLRHNPVGYTGGGGRSSGRLEMQSEKVPLNRTPHSPFAEQGATPCDMFQGVRKGRGKR